ncbi:ABC transporter substrate-binding protein [Ochrobactrum sp. A-1]|uniref:ABC transporter substrate-binding protein n=1 Tax=Ochrobactrum sp. A-1 TaxID=2920940 RepID=UPI001F0A2630|nr:ABC transporter substrate-binding protein [Ochrobactrum sp. A-1]
MKTFLPAIFCASFLATAANAANLTIATEPLGELLKADIARFEEQTGNSVTVVAMPSSSSEQFSQYRLWLAAENSDIDVYETDVTWPAQLGDKFIDLTDATKDVTAQFLPVTLQAQRVGGRLVALPFYADAPALFYRKDLLEKYKKDVPKTWSELEATAAEIQEKERAAGHADFWGYVFQAKAFEGLTCNALEWFKSSGGGQIVEPDGTISVNNPQAAAALDMAASWVGKIAPQGVLTYEEDDTRGIWERGNALFMRNWAYAYPLGNSGDSAVKGAFDIAPIPAGPGGKSVATIGGYSLAVSKFSKNREAAIALVKFLNSPESQKHRALQAGFMPTLTALYDDPELVKAQPSMPAWKGLFAHADARPSAPTKAKYNEVSARVWGAVHNTLSGEGTAAENLELLEQDLTELKGQAW